MTSTSTQMAEASRREKAEARRLKKHAKRAAKRVTPGSGLERGVLRHAMQLLARAKRREARADGRSMPADQ